MPAGSIATTVPVKVRVGYAVSEKFTFWPGWTLPMSASLTAALTCGELRSLSVMSASLEVVLVDEVRAGRPAADPLARPRR